MMTLLGGAYLDLARLWRKLAHQAQQKELGSNTDAALSCWSHRFGKRPEWLAMTCLAFKKRSSIRLLPRRTDNSSLGERLLCAPSAISAFALTSPTIADALIADVVITSQAELSLLLSGGDTQMFALHLQCPPQAKL
jgi:hypothetical protein